MPSKTFPAKGETSPPGSNILKDELNLLLGTSALA